MCLNLNCFYVLKRKEKRQKFVIHTQLTNNINGNNNNENSNTDLHNNNPTQSGGDILMKEQEKMFESLRSQPLTFNFSQQKKNQGFYQDIKVIGHHNQ